MRQEMNTLLVGLAHHEQYATLPLTGLEGIVFPVPFSAMSTTFENSESGNQVALFDME